MNFVFPLGKTRIKLKGKVGVPGGHMGSNQDF